MGTHCWYCTCCHRVTVPSPGNSGGCQEESNPNDFHASLQLLDARSRQGLFTASSHPVSTPGTTDVDRSSSEWQKNLERNSPYDESRGKAKPSEIHLTTDQGNRRKVANALIAIGHQLGTASKGPIRRLRVQARQSARLPRDPRRGAPEQCPASD